MPGHLPGDPFSLGGRPSGTSGAAREVPERLFSVFGSFLAAMGAPRGVQERPGEGKSDQNETKSEPRWH